MPLTDAEVQTLISTRRDLHRHPELGYQERRTADVVAERLRAAGFEVRERVAETGVVGTLRGAAGDGPTLVLRADMDALPIQEENAHAFTSVHPGRMHACGHDAHMAIGLAVAERLAQRRAEWPGTVRYVFQPAEEGGGGALRMVESGVLDGADAVLGLHVWMALDKETIGVVPGPMMAGSTDFRLVVHGRGGHGAIPQETVDSIVVASHLVVALQSIVARQVSPLDTAVVSVGAFHAGTAFNAIADSAVLEGTIRAYRMELLEELGERIRAVAAGVCSAFGASFDLHLGVMPYPPTVNDPAMTARVVRAAEAVVGPERVRTDPEVRTMAAEDFAEFSRRVPGCFFFLGIRDEAAGVVHPHHSPWFDVSEEALPVGVEVLERAALSFLRGEE